MERARDYSKAAKPERPVSAQRPQGLVQIELPYSDYDVLEVFPRCE